MKCEEAVAKLWQYLDRELDDKAMVEIERHLEDCRECFSKAQFERQLRALMRRSCGREHAPARLRARLHQLLRMF